MIDNLKSLRLLWTNLATNHRYKEFYDSRDIEEFVKRLDNEGITFLTCVLPRIGKALDKFHATTVWDPPDGFKKSKEDGLPLFLRGPIKQALAGYSLAVDYVRQMTLIFYKLEVDYDSETVSKFLDDFRKVDHDLALSNYHEGVSINLREQLDNMARVISRVLCNADPLDIRPYHGSGATACHTRNYDKWHKLRYYPALDAYYTYSEYFFYSPSHLIDEMEKLEKSEESTPQARVVLVPKDSRGPRVISCEPAELMYIQQGIMGKLYEVLETHPLTAGQINFTDQEVNRKLARQGSLLDNLATLDLSEASDRVSWSLIRRVFPKVWVEALSACRSTHTLLPDGSVMELNKFAPMGSSCCFPVEALVFWASAYAKINMGGRPSSKAEIYVYGDDIIVPSALADDVIGALESVGLKVNREKSYSSGPFRESCGGDYHKGMDVSPVRVRNFLTSVGTGLATGADLANLLIAKFGVQNSSSLISVIEEALDYVFPRTELPLPGCIRVLPSASNDVFFRRRWNKDLQRFEHRVLAYYTSASARREIAWSELLRKELSRGRQSNDFSREGRMPVIAGSLKPGEYADPYSARKKWAWTWLG